ncbi:hypothetical protein NMK54_33695, partial [Nocardia otitidiscaviarum]|nr:hypothetical protein [Nocardia otitidiscaviarum]
HHWIWIAPALLAMVGYATRLPWRQGIGWYAAAAVTAAIYVIGPQNWLPDGEHRETTWTPWQHFVGNTYIWWSLLLVALFLVATRRRSLPAAVTAPELTPAR